jgi:hypothetical protein
MFLTLEVLSSNLEGNVKVPFIIADGCSDQVLTSWKLIILQC